MALSMFPSIVWILCLGLFSNIFVQASTFYRENASELTALDIFLGSDDHLFPIGGQNNLNEKRADLIAQLKSRLHDSQFGIEQIYKNYLKSYGKDPSRANDGVHLPIFAANLMTIAEHNLKADEGKFSYKMGVNPFTDMSSSEFQSTHTGHNVSVIDSFMNSGIPLDSENFEPKSMVSAAASKDWRQGGKVAKIKDQGECGSCVTFATISVVESAYAIKGQTIKEYSEQEIVDCTNIGCNGGDWPEAFDYMKNGVSTGAQYPYKGKRGSCSSSSNNRNNGAKISSWGYLSERSWFSRKGSETKMRDYVGDNGPIVFGVSVSNSFQNYKSGVFTGPCSGNINHAVSTVGYGNEGGKDYWIIRNSWGTRWGENGYMKLERGKNTCRVSEDAAYAKI